MNGHELHAQKLAGLRGATRDWYDVSSAQWVRAATLYLPQGCADWGERGGARNELCTFCALPHAARQYREAFFDGRPLTPDQHFDLFSENLGQIGEGVHTLFVFNAGSFLAALANPPALQRRIVDAVAKHPSIERLVVESRAELITADAVAPLAEALGAAGKSLTIRIGVETQDDHLRLHVLRKGHARRQLFSAMEVMRAHGILAGAYTLLNPAPNLDPRYAVDEASATLEWVFDGLGMQEAYFGPTCVGPDTPLERFWRAGEFRPASLWMVWAVLRRSVPRYGRRIHLLPFVDEPPFLAVPSNHVPAGLPESLEGAEGCDLEFHKLFERYRSTMNPDLLDSPPTCVCKPDWIG